jgi:hypothetical protein
MLKMATMCVILLFLGITNLVLLVWNASNDSHPLHSLILNALAAFFCLLSSGYWLGVLTGPRYEKE